MIEVWVCDFNKDRVLVYKIGEGTKKLGTYKGVILR